MLEGRWYIYDAADDGDSASHRMDALASASGSMAYAHGLERAGVWHTLHEPWTGRSPSGAG